MTSKRKAEIQRKLSMTTLPKPPDDLAERIKRDIPDSLFATPEQERDRFARSLGFNLRVAASILLLITSALVGVHVLTRVGEEPIPAAAMSKQADRVTAAAESDAAAPASAAAAPAPVAQEVVVNRAEPASKLAFAARERKENEGSKSEAPSADEATGVRVAREQVAAAEEARPVAEPQAMQPAAIAMATPAPPAAPAPAPPAQVEAGFQGAVVGGVVGGNTATAAKRRAESTTTSLARDARSSLGKASETVFGVSTDRGAFDRLKSAIEQGEKPTASTVDIEALVNYFAGTAERVRRDVQLDVEASATPVGSDKWEWIVRVSIDTPRSGTPAVVATNARVDIEFDGHAVVSQERVGGSTSTSALQGSLRNNTAVTMLHEVRLRGNLRPWQRVATITLSYLGRDGRRNTAERRLYVKDFSAWSAASRRHRIASLGAVWAETLQGASAESAEVAQRAEELATQDPRDGRARELANLASATSASF